MIQLNESDAHHIDELALSLVRNHLPDVTEDDAKEKATAEELAGRFKKTLDAFVRKHK